MAASTPAKPPPNIKKCFIMYSIIELQKYANLSVMQLKTEHSKGGLN
jgi:hypothetical protein